MTPSSPYVTTDDLRERANAWSLAGDSDLRKHMEGFSKLLESRAEKVVVSMRDLERRLLAVQTSIGNVQTQFALMSHSQFIEARVNEDDEVEEEPEKKTDLVRASVPDDDATEAEFRLKATAALQTAVQFVNSTFHRVGDDVSSSEPPVYETKNPHYSSRRLPHIIGSAAFLNDDTIGLADSKSPEGADEHRLGEATSSHDQSSRLPARGRRGNDVDSMAGPHRRGNNQSKLDLFESEVGGGASSFATTEQEMPDPPEAARAMDLLSELTNKLDVSKPKVVEPLSKLPRQQTKSFLFDDDSDDDDELFTSTERDEFREAERQGFERKKAWNANSVHTSGIAVEAKYLFSSSDEEDGMEDLFSSLAAKSIRPHGDGDDDEGGRPRSTQGSVAPQHPIRVDGKANVQDEAGDAPKVETGDANTESFAKMRRNVDVLEDVIVSEAFDAKLIKSRPRIGSRRKLPTRRCGKRVDSNLEAIKVSTDEKVDKGGEREGRASVPKDFSDRISSVPSGVCSGQLSVQGVGDVKSSRMSLETAEDLAHPHTNQREGVVEGEVSRLRHESHEPRLEVDDGDLFASPAPIPDCIQSKSALNDLFDDDYDSDDLFRTGATSVNT